MANGTTNTNGTNPSGTNTDGTNHIHRTFSNYARMSRNGRNGMRFSSLEEWKMRRKPKASFLYKTKDFLTDNFIAWFVHTWWIKKRGAYPPISAASIHDLEKAPGGGIPGGDISGGPITLCIAADWASATGQAAFVASAMKQKDADYTIHLGDTYYSGTVAELAANFGVASRPSATPGPDLHGATPDPGPPYLSIWPRGRKGSFASPGNHELFSSGIPFFQMIGARTRGFGMVDTDSGLFTGQENPCFCMLTSHWCILCLDTGYDSLKQRWYQRILNLHPNNLALKFPASIGGWLKDTVKPRIGKRGILILTHHQYVSAFKGENDFTGPAAELKSLLPDNKEVIWIWGHEHRFALYGKYQKDPGFITAHGRCIGHGGMPDEHLPDRVVDPEKLKGLTLLLTDPRVADTIVLNDASRTQVGYNGYTHLTIDGPELAITYFSAYGTSGDYVKGIDQPLAKETWHADIELGVINCSGIVDCIHDKVIGGKD